MVYGTVRINNGRKQMVHPEVTLRKGQDSKFQFAYYPVYSAVKGISGNLMRSLMENAMNTYLEYIADPVPKNVTGKLDLPDLKQAIRDIYCQIYMERSSWTTYERAMFSPRNKNTIARWFFYTY